MSGNNGSPGGPDNLAGVQHSVPAASEQLERLGVAVQSEQTMIREGVGESAPHDLPSMLGVMTVVLMERWELAQLKHPSVSFISGCMNRVFPFRQNTKKYPAHAVYAQPANDPNFNSLGLSDPRVPIIRRNPILDEI